MKQKQTAPLLTEADTLFVCSQLQISIERHTRLLHKAEFRLDHLVNEVSKDIEAAYAKKWYSQERYESEVQANRRGIEFQKNAIQKYKKTIEQAQAVLQKLQPAEAKEQQAQPEQQALPERKKAPKMTFREIQSEVISKYRIKYKEKSECWGRTHVHIKQRTICKWSPSSSVQSTFTLLHEVGHIENNHAGMRRVEQEYYATVWAIEQASYYGLKIPEKEKVAYQQYVDRCLDRGIRRGGKNYMNSDNYNLDWLDT